LTPCITVYRASDPSRGGQGRLRRVATSCEGTRCCAVDTNRRARLPWFVKTTCYEFCDLFIRSPASSATLSETRRSGPRPESTASRRLRFLYRVALLSISLSFRPSSSLLNAPATSCRHQVAHILPPPTSTPSLPLAAAIRQPDAFERTNRPSICRHPPSPRSSSMTRTISMYSALAVRARELKSRRQHSLKSKVGAERDGRAPFSPTGALTLFSCGSVGMTCGACVASIEGGLRVQEGISSVKVALL
jgi:hypothetical protein